MHNNSLKIARSFLRVHFKRIFKYHEWRYILHGLLELSYYFVVKITNARA